MPYSTKKPRILVVEDELIVARDIQMQLFELGYEPVGHAAHGEDAISLARELRPDLVLMDIQLAGSMDGVAAADVIRRELSLPVVFLTAFSGDDVIERAKLVEPFGYILKPFAERELRTVLSMALYKHQVEAKMRLSDAALKAVSQGVLIADSKRRILSANAAFLEITGYEEHEILGRGCAFLQGAQTDPQQILAMRQALNHAVPFTGEVLNYKKDGTPFWNELSLSPVLNEHGELTHFVGITRDVTRRKLVEQQLAERTALLKRTSAIAKVGGWELDAETMVGRWSEETSRIHGLDPASGAPSVEQTINYYTPASQPIVLAAMHAGLADGTPFDLDLQLITVPGQLVWVRVQGEAVTEHGKVVKLVGAIQDISEQRRTADALRQSEAIQRATLDALPDLLFRMGLDGRYLSYHSPRTDLLYAPPESFSGKLVSEVLPPEAAQVVIAALNEAHETGLSAGKQLMLDLPSGNAWFELAVAPERTQDGEAPRFVVVSRDITERKLAEEALRQSEAKRWRVGERLWRAHDEERRRIARELHDHTGSTMAAMVLHTKLIQNSEAAPATRDAITKLAAVMTESLKDLSRLARGLHPIALDELGLQAAIEQLVRALTAGSEMAGRVVYAVSDPRISPELELALYRIVQEAVTNVVKHANATHVTVKCVQEGRDIVLRIQDDGAGFDVQEPPKRGAQLGLVTMPERARLLGGSAQIRSVPGEGTIVEARFSLDANNNQQTRA